MLASCCCARLPGENGDCFNGWHERVLIRRHDTPIFADGVDDENVW